MRMDADPHDRRPSWLSSTVPAGHGTVSVRPATLWITLLGSAGRPSIDALNCGGETTGDPGPPPEKRRGREHVQLPASECAAQLLAPARLKGTSHLYNAALCLLS